jgi:hypothetical protein
MHLEAHGIYEMAIYKMANHWKPCAPNVLKRNVVMSKDDVFIFEKSKWEFYARISGQKLRELPNHNIVVPPILNFNLHDLADHGWQFKVIQRGLAGMYGHHRINGHPEVAFKSRPKVSLVQNGVKNGQIKFRLPSRSMYTSLEEVFADLERHKFEVSNVCVPTGLEEGSVWIPTVDLWEVMPDARSRILAKEKEIATNIDDMLDILKEKGYSIQPPPMAKPYQSEEDVVDLMLEELANSHNSAVEGVKVHEENLRKKWLEELDELEVTKMFNDRRHSKMLEMLKQKPKTEVKLPDNIIDFVKELQRRQVDVETTEAIAERLQQKLG